MFSSLVGRRLYQTPSKAPFMFFNIASVKNQFIFTQKRSYYLESRYLAVADGVGGWAMNGVDSGLYSREILTRVVEVLRENASHSKHTPDPVEVLKQAYLRTMAVGSTTVCMVFYDEYSRSLRTANLGDSGFIVYRPTEHRVVARSDFQFHDFNFPFQLGTGSPDLPEHADATEVPVSPGDVVVLGTDGLWDNLFEEEIVDLIKQAGDEIASKEATKQLTDEIAKAAFAASLNPRRKSPFAEKSSLAGKRFEGGKSDDISIVAAVVRDPWHMKRSEVPESVARNLQIDEFIEELRQDSQVRKEARQKSRVANARRKKEELKAARGLKEPEF